jgi:hypothetical protein
LLIIAALVVVQVVHARYRKNQLRRLQQAADPPVEQENEQTEDTTARASNVSVK